MPLRTIAYYRQLAEDSLKKAGVIEPPYDLAGLAAHFGVPVMRIRLPAFFAGALIAEDGLPVILLNTNREELVQRRTLGHLLAHIIMVLDDPAATYPRNTQGEHTAADAMSESLMLPEFMVSEQARKWFNDYRYLARLFAVPESQMMERMRDLGILKARGIVWDY